MLIYLSLNLPSSYFVVVVVTFVVLFSFPAILHYLVGSQPSGRVLKNVLSSFLTLAAGGVPIECVVWTGGRHLYSGGHWDHTAMSSLEMVHARPFKNNEPARVRGARGIKALF